MTGQVLEALAIVAVPFAGTWLWRAIFRHQAPCRWCGGTGRVGTRQRWRPCSHCDGSGRRMTWGGRLVRGQVRFSVGRWGR